MDNTIVLTVDGTEVFNSKTWTSQSTAALTTAQSSPTPPKPLPIGAIKENGKIYIPVKNPQHGHIYNYYTDKNTKRPVIFTRGEYTGTQFMSNPNSNDPNDDYEVYNMAYGDGKLVIRSTPTIVYDEYETGGGGGGKRSDQKRKKSRKQKRRVRKSRRNHRR